MENKIIITIYPTGILILDEWLTTIKIEDASNNNIQQFWITPMPGFDESTFPFLVCSGYETLSLININPYANSLQTTSIKRMEWSKVHWRVWGCPLLCLKIPSENGWLNIWLKQKIGTWQNKSNSSSNLGYPSNFQPMTFFKLNNSPSKIFPWIKTISKP